MAAVICLLCRSSLERTNQRRKLHSDSTKRVYTILRESVGELKTSAIAIIFHPEAYLCRSCVRNVERVQKLREDLRKKETEIRQKMVRVVEALGLTRDEEQGTSASFRTPDKKRSASEAELESPTVGMKKRRYDTPTRQTLARMCPTGTSPAVAVLVKGRKKARAHAIPKSSGLKKLAQGVARRNRSSIGRQAVRDPRIRKRVLCILTKDIQKEMTTLCAKKTNSMLRQSSIKAISEFSWDTLTAELERVAPTLHTILKGCVDVKRRKQNKAETSQQQKSRIKTKRPSNTAILGVCASILLRHKNMHMNALQHVVSLVLHAGHSAKQVYMRLQKLLLCLSRHRTLAYLDHIGKNHDAKVLQWRANIEDTMRTSKFVTQEGNSVSQGNLRAQSGMIQPALHLGDVGDSGHISESSKEGYTTQSSTSSSSPENSQTESSAITSPTVSEFTTDSSSSLNIDDFLGPVSTPPPPALKTYKLVGDNIDKQIHPRDMRSDHQTRSLHYFHTYAVRDRVDLTTVSDEKTVPGLKSIRLDELLPTSSDKKELLKNFGILFARTIKKHMPYFKKFGKGLERHIQHEFSQEMSQKSEVVPLGIELKSEQKYEEMVDILASLHKYVPTVTTTQTVNLPGETTEVTCDDFFQTELGGDQMTAARVRGSQRIRSNSERGVDRLQGLVGVTEDWHAKMCFLGVIWKRLYTCSSGMDGGTLFQLRNLINRRNIVKDPSKNMNACEDFYTLVVQSHIIAAAMAIFRMSSVDDQPCSTLFPEGSSELDSVQRRNILLLAVERVLDEFVDLSFGDDSIQEENIPGDLHMEHLNRECKNALSGLGSNITDQSVKRIGRCIGKSVDMLEAFDQENGLHHQSGYHTHRSSGGDMKKLITQLTETSKVFESHNGRFHKNFPNFSSNTMLKVSMPELKQWMSEQMQKLLTYMHT